MTDNKSFDHRINALPILHRVLVVSGLICLGSFVGIIIGFGLVGVIKWINQ